MAEDSTCLDQLKEKLISQEEGEKYILEWFGEDFAGITRDVETKVETAFYDHHYLTPLLCVFASQDGKPVIFFDALEVHPESGICVESGRRLVIQVQQKADVKGLGVICECWAVMMTDEERALQVGALSHNEEAVEAVQMFYFKRDYVGILGLAPIITAVDTHGKLLRYLDTSSYYEPAEAGGRVVELWPDAEKQGDSEYSRWKWET